jgi:hypothetical protein
MRYSLLAVGSLCLALGLGFGPSCSSDDDPGPGTGGTGGTAGRGGTGGSTGGTGGSTGGTGGSTGGTGGSTGGTGGSTGGTGGSGVTYAMVQPIFKAKCGPCHDTGGSAGLPKFAGMFSETTKNVITGAAECGSGTKVGACTIVRIKSGSMPFNKMCKPEAGQPPMPDMCLTATEQATIQAWVDGGARE